MASSRILIVDDTGFSRIVIEKTLSHLDCDYAHAADGEAALQSLSTERFDLVVTDYLMPEMDGLELYRRALGSKFRDDLGVIPCPPFILVTAHSSRELEESAKHLGIFAVVQKCNQERDLPNKVIQSLRAAVCNIHIVLKDDEALQFQSLSQALGVQTHSLAHAIILGFLKNSEIEEIKSIKEISESIRVDQRTR